MTASPRLLAGDIPRIAKALRLLPPGGSKQESVRSLGIHEDDALGEGRLAASIAQASRRPGWGKA